MLSKLFQGEVPGDASLPAGASAASAVQLKCPSSMALLHSPEGQSCQQPGFQTPCESAGPFLPSVRHRKVTLNGFIECVHCVSLLLSLVRCWILIRRLLGFTHCPWEKYFLSLCICLPVLSSLCVCVLLVLSANFIKTEVVSWKYLHNTQLEEAPTAVSDCTGCENRALQGITPCPPSWMGPFCRVQHLQELHFHLK